METTKGTIYKGKKDKFTDDINIYRSLPNRYTQAIGSMVLLDHVPEHPIKAKEAEMPDGSFAHPHKGIATFTYLLEGSVHHIDSAGGEGIVHAGGIQWMKAGNGIIHDEFLPYEFQKSGGTLNSLQFWLNLPAKIKAEEPEYIAVQTKSIPEITLPNHKGRLKVLLGEYGTHHSIIPNYLEQFMYHVQLNPKQIFELSINDGWQYGIYVIKGEATIDNTVVVNKMELAELFDLGTGAQIKNDENDTLDIIIFGGEPYTEPAVPYGPFIMNTREEIGKAYSEYQKGKYGYIDYAKVAL